jgi:hypothetical protein
MLLSETSARITGAIARAGEDELRERYAAYRRRHASRLLQMLPRDAIRPLYRRARAEAAREGTLEGPLGDDPLALLVEYCESLLPLPPYDVWRLDLARNPDAHFADLEESLDGPTADAPSTMEARSVGYAGRMWIAHLRAFREDGFWRAYISFEEAASGRVHRTAPVFYERDAKELRDRFLSFESGALQAFLRSALP